MTNNTYLLRFDDICPTMNWEVWEEIEAALIRFDIKPILAVVPDNQDPNLAVSPARPDFWDRVRDWQSRGWTIALHGYQHVYQNRNPGMLRLNPQSEFAGLPRAEQREKLRKGIALFAEHGIRADAWVAPAHSFDENTISCLRELGVSVISDGLWPWPFTDRHGVTWVPQQLWGFLPKPEGVWTVCAHHNPWTRADLDLFVANLATYAPRMVGLTYAAQTFGNRRRTLGDRLVAWKHLNWTFGLRRWLVKTANHLRKHS